MHEYTQVPPVDVSHLCKVVRLIDFANMIYNMEQHWRSARMRTQDLLRMYGNRANNRMSQWVERGSSVLQKSYTIKQYWFRIGGRKWSCSWVCDFVNPFYMGKRKRWQSLLRKTCRKEWQFFCNIPMDEGKWFHQPRETKILKNWSKSKAKKQKKLSASLKPSKTTTMRPPRSRSQPVHLSDYIFTATAKYKNLFNKPGFWHLTLLGPSKYTILPWTRVKQHWLISNKLCCSCSPCLPFLI